MQNQLENLNPLSASETLGAKLHGNENDSKSKKIADEWGLSFKHVKKKNVKVNRRDFFFLIQKIIIPFELLKETSAMKN